MLEWYAPNTITFNREQIIFLLENLSTLRMGEWPPHPNGSNYTDAPDKQKIKPYAHFETPVLFAAEIDRRLDACKIDGLLTELFYTHKVDEDVLGARLGKSFQEIASRIATCIWHIKGYNFRGLGYQRGNYANRIQSEKGGYRK